MPSTPIRLLCSLLLLTSMGAARGATDGWRPVGLSGGGAMFCPIISPLDGRLMMLDCDMSAAYMSHDGGLTWTMINQHEIRGDTGCKGAFDPVDPRLVYAANGATGGLVVSTDQGVHWRALPGIHDDLQGEIAINPVDHAIILAGCRHGCWLSRDAALTWHQCQGPTGRAISFVYSRSADGASQTWFAATDKGIWASKDHGATWKPCDHDLPSRPIKDMSGGCDAAHGLTVLYCSVPCSAVHGRIAGGVFVSHDLGATWTSAMGGGINCDIKAADQWADGSIVQYTRVLACDHNPDIVYAFNTNTGIAPPHQTAAYRSADAGRTWKATFFPDPRYPGFNVEPDYVVTNEGQFYQDGSMAVAIDPRDSDHLMQTDGGRCYITADGGHHWTCGHSHPVPPKVPGAKPTAWINNGLVVTTTWNYAIDPFVPERRYICYTDIGFATSDDAGATWSWWDRKGRPPWQNTCYQVAFDTSVPGLMWGAFSNVHDIPNGNIIFHNGHGEGPGCIAVSRDHGRTWSVSGTGLPRAPAVSIVVDGQSPVADRILYAAMFGKGVFRSNDGGRTWKPENEGLGTGANRRAVSVAVASDGTIYALVTGMWAKHRFLDNGCGLYASTDQGGHWHSITTSRHFLWPKSFTIDPQDPATIYLSDCDTNGKESAGLYRTRDRGAHWTLLGRKGPEHFGGFPSPWHPGWIYMTLTEGAPDAGLWLSKDDGKTWTAIESLPFSNIQRVFFDPAHHDRIILSTFGGSVWEGPAD